MRNILLACSSGMSTSLLVSKMESEADKRGLDVKIWAVSQDRAEKEIQEADVLLIGPQMRFMKTKLEKIGKDINVPVDIINPVDYGRMNGVGVLDTALDLINSNF
mgnify:CR=1 FL=1